ncbi:MAG: hypothetical protein IPP78_05530 [Holophagaceae bacterium]|nr:hypothetical protein [Holophagaceae bacterium]
MSVHTTPAAPVAPSPDTQLSQTEIDAIHNKIQKQKTHAGGAGWFYWIAGLSLITSVVSLSGGTWSFLAGLGVTQLFDGFAIGLTKSGIGDWIKVLGFFLDVLAAAVFVVIGYFAKKGSRATYITGMVLYGIDSAILLLFQEWIGLAFHAFALFQIWNGLAALGWLNASSAAAAAIQSPVEESTAVEPT